MTNTNNTLDELIKSPNKKILEEFMANKNLDTTNILTLMWVDWQNWCLRELSKKEPQSDVEQVERFLGNVAEYIDLEVARQLQLAKIEAKIENTQDISKMFETHLYDPTGSMGFDEHASRRSEDEIDRARQYNHNHAWAAISAKSKVDDYLSELTKQKKELQL